MKNLATPSSILILISSSSTKELCSQPIRGNVCWIGQMFPEHVERSFLDPEYSFVAVEWILQTIFAKQKNTPNYICETKVHPIKNKLYSLNTPNYVHEQMFTQLRMGFTSSYQFQWPGFFSPGHSDTRKVKLKVTFSQSDVNVLKFCIGLNGKDPVPNAFCDISCTKCFLWH